MNGAKLLQNTMNKGSNAPNGGKGINSSPQKNESVDTSAIEENTFDKEKLDRMYNFPANYKEAEVHAIASKFGYSNNKLKRQNRQIPVCPCCQNLVATIDIPLSYSTIPGKPQVGREVFLLPTGASMYFTFIKMVLFYLLIRLIVFDIFNYISSSSGKFCAENKTGTDKCMQTSFLNTSGYNLKSLQNQQVLNILDIISLAFTLVSIIYFTIVRKNMYNLISWLDFNDVSQMDFSILIQNIPLFICDQTTDKGQATFEFQQQLQDIIQEKIQYWLESLDQYTKEEDIPNQLQRDFWKFIYSKKKDMIWNENNPDPIVAGITLCYDLTQMQNLIKYRDELIERYLEKDEAQVANQRKQNAKNRKSGQPQQIMNVQLPKQRRLDQIPNQIDVLNQQYMNLCRQFAQNNTNAFNLSHFTGKVFISFQYQHYRDYFIREYQNNKKFLTINQNQIKISLTNKPEDIYWFNMKVSDSDRAKNIFYSYAILFMLLVLSFAALMGIQFWQKDQNTRNSQIQLDASKSDFIRKNLVSICMAILTNIINTVLSTSIELLSNMEQHQTKTQRLSSVIIKTIVSQALNTSFIYYFLFLIFKNNPLGTHGLVNQVLNLVTVSGFISVVLQIFPPSLLFRQIMNNWKYKPDKPINLFQIQLNQALQKPQFNYAIMYSFYIVFTFVVSFYGFIVPSATAIMIGIFFLQYWVDKYNLFRRYSSPVDFGADLIRWIFKMFEFNILFFAAGYFFWSFTVHFDSPSEYRSICIVNVSIAFLYVVLTLLIPPKIRRKILGQQPADYDHHSYSYYLNKRRFKKTFFKESPATFCLKQAATNKKGYFLPTAPDPDFVKEEEFQKFLDLKDDELEIEVYDKAEVDYFQNMNNSDYDEVAAEQILAKQVVGDVLNQVPGNTK